MDSRAKQRLTGAVILVTLFVLLVPELLTGPKGTGVSTTPEEEGLRSYTIDLETKAAAANPPAAAEPSMNLPAVVESPMAPATARAVPGEAAAPEAPAASDSSTPPQVAPRAQETRPTQPAAQPTPAPQAAAKPVASAPAASAPAASRPERGSFVVQLGSFSSRENAERLVRDMNAKGFATYMAPITTNGRELYRVRVGPTKDRASAEALAAQLKRVGQSGSIVPIS
jgi:DedD protein